MVCYVELQILIADHKQERPRWYQQNLRFLISNQQILLVAAGFK